MKLILTVLFFTLAISSRADEDYQKVTYFLKHQPKNTELLLRRLNQVSDPDHQSYGQFLKHQEVIELQRPKQEHIAILKTHLQEIEAKWVESSIAGDKVVAQVPKEAVLAESLEDHLRKREYLLPSYLKDQAVDMVSGIKLGYNSESRYNFENVKPEINAHQFDFDIGSQQTTEGDEMHCLAEKVTPTCLRKAYGLDTPSKSESSKNKQMVIVNQSFKDTDLATFQKQYSLPDQKVAKKIGPWDDTAQTQASLDIEYITTTGQLVQTWWFWINGHIDNPFADWVTWSTNTTDIPYVHSLSVGGPEDEFARDNGGDIAITRMNNQMAALGVRGVSILFASGDSGYVPNLKYGASSPYVTSIGGVFNGDIGYDPLEADYISTGGVSQQAPNTIQDYQKSAVNKYLDETTGQRPANMNRERRFVPDISAYDSGYSIITSGSETYIGGTSAATPTVAGMIASINQDLIANGHGPMGFLNPFLYKNADLFYDITQGNINGIEAVKGYDPASGIGTFDTTTFQKLKQTALATKERASSRVKIQ